MTPATAHPMPGSGNNRQHRPTAGPPEGRQPPGALGVSGGEALPATSQIPAGARLPRWLVAVLAVLLLLLAYHALT